MKSQSLTLSLLVFCDGLKMWDALAVTEPLRNPAPPHTSTGESPLTQAQASHLPGPSAPSAFITMSI